MTKIAGIIGGMGPLSTIELLEKIFNYTPAEREQNHLRVLVDNHPQIPDRTDFIIGKGISPLPMMTESARLLQKWGADFLAIACNTAHYFYADIQKSVSIPLLNMLELVADEVYRLVPDGKRVAILTTNGARQANLFEAYLKAYQIVYPDPQIQQSCLMDAVYGKNGIKTRKLTDDNVGKIMLVIEKVMRFQPALIIAGCTEIELALAGRKWDCPVVFPLDLLAREIVKTAY
jgi:aspartate racemase